MPYDSKLKFPIPDASRLSEDNRFYEEIISLHEEACKNKQEIYTDPETGFKVFTAYFHLARGSCCGNGCRHCPYL